MINFGRSGTSLTPSSFKNEYSCERGLISNQSIIGNSFHWSWLATDGKWRSHGLNLRLVESSDSNVVARKPKSRVINICQRQIKEQT